MIDTATKLQTEETVALRCKYCAAPLTNIKHGSEYFKCDSCGTVQKTVDAKAFLDQIMGHVYAWISTAIPTGFNMSLAANADPVARHSIFVNNIRPILETEFTEYRFNNTKLLSNTLMVLPFCTDRSIYPGNKPSQVFEFNAKIKSVTPLAVDDPSRQLLDDINRISLVYAYLLNNVTLMAEGKAEGFHLMSTNFQEAAQVLKGADRYRWMMDRMIGLSHMAMAIDHLLSGKVSECRVQATQGIGQLENSRKEALESIEFGVMVHYIDKELNISRIVLNAAEMAEEDPSNNPLTTMALVERIIRLNTGQLTYATERWKLTFQDNSRFGEILGFMAWISKAKVGKSSLPISAGGGRYLIPFWVIDLPYSFMTGALWMKKGVEAHEFLLVPAGFTTEPQALKDPSMAITDVFRSNNKNGAMKSITGKESSISQGEQIRDLISTVGMSQIGSRKVLVPLCTRKEAEKLTTEYLAQLRATNNDLANKLRLSAPKVDRLVFIPGDINDQGYTLSSDLGRLYPRTIGRVQTLSLMTI